MANIYVKFDTPEEIANKAEEALEVAQNTGKVAKGTNEVTKFIPVLAEEKEIPYVYLATKDKVGAAAGLSVGTASACIVDAGDAADLVAEVVEKVAELKE